MTYYMLCFKWITISISIGGEYNRKIIIIFWYYLEFVLCTLKKSGEERDKNDTKRVLFRVFYSG